MPYTFSVGANTLGVASTVIVQPYTIQSIFGKEKIIAHDEETALNFLLAGYESKQFQHWSMVFFEGFIQFEITSTEGHSLYLVRVVKGKVIMKWKPRLIK